MSRRSLLLAGGSAITGLLVPGAIHSPAGLVWNASASAPIGLYAVRPVHTPVRGVLLVLALPAPLARFAAERHYLPLGVPLIKPVAAASGQVVCRADRGITIDHHAVAQALARDGRGRPLPVWRGCRTLGQGEVFVMNVAVRDSFDGRYFGPLPASTVLGRARPLLTESPTTHPQRS